jgi:hypothetical protein
MKGIMKITTPISAEVEDQYNIYKKIYESAKARYDFFKWDFGYYLCNTKVLSEDFIERYIDELDFQSLQTGQKVSVDFVKKHINKCDMKYLSQNKHFSKEDLQNIKECMEQYGDLF